MAPSRLQRVLKPTEADMLAEQPLFIGLLSMLTGSSDLQELQTIARRLRDHGRDILGITSENRKMPTTQEFQTAA